MGFPKPKDQIILNKEQAGNLLWNVLLSKDGSIGPALKDDVKKYLIDNPVKATFASESDITSKYNEAFDAIQSIYNLYMDDFGSEKSLQQIENDIKNIANNPASYLGRLVNSRKISQDTSDTIIGMKGNSEAFEVFTRFSVNDEKDLNQAGYYFPKEQVNAPANPIVTKRIITQKKDVRANNPSLTVAPANVNDPIVPKQVEEPAPAVRKDAYQADLSDVKTGGVSDFLGGDIGKKLTDFFIGDNGMPVTTLFTMIVRFFTSMFGMLNKDKGIDIPDEHKIEITRVVTIQAAGEVLKKAGEFYDTENNRLEFKPEAFRKFTDAQKGLMQFASEFFNKKVQENGGKEIDSDKLKTIMDELAVELSKRIKSDFTDGLKKEDFIAFPLEKDGKKGYLNAATDEVIYADANAIQEYVRKQEASGQKISLDELSKYNNVLWPSVREVSIGKS